MSQSRDSETLLLNTAAANPHHSLNVPTQTPDIAIALLQADCRTTTNSLNATEMAAMLDNFKKKAVYRARDRLYNET